MKRSRMIHCICASFALTYALASATNARADDDGGYVQHNLVSDGFVAAVEAARKHGTIVSYDLNYRASLWKSQGGQDAARKVRRALAAVKGKGKLQAQWKAEIECKLGRHSEAMKPRLFPEIPPNRYEGDAVVVVGEDPKGA